MNQPTSSETDSTKVAQARLVMTTLLRALEIRDAQSVRSIYEKERSSEDLRLAFGETVRFLFDYITSVAGDLQDNACADDIGTGGDVLRICDLIEGDLEVGFMGRAEELGTLPEFAEIRQEGHHKA